MFQTFLIFHISAGFASLLFGALAMIARKGSSSHRKRGRLFVYSMISVILTAILICLIKPNSFLLSIAMFSAFLCLSGWVFALKLEQNKKAILIRLSSILGLLLFAVMMKLAFTERGLNIVLLVFSLITFSLSIQSWLSARKIKSYVVQHISRMGGAYIAAVTAFLVVNINFIPGIFLWLGPTILGSVFITLSIRNWTSKTQRIK